MNISVPRLRLSALSSVLLAGMLALFLASTGSVHADDPVISPMKMVAAATSKGKFSWHVELASDDQQRATGLMFRKEMPAATGMLFRFDETRAVTMWMKNTFIPLDMVFADPSGRVTHIHRSAVPQSLEFISSNGPARYVLEVNAGEADTTGLTVGTVLRHPWFSPPN